MLGGAYRCVYVCVCVRVHNVVGAGELHSEDLGARPRVSCLHPLNMGLCLLLHKYTVARPGMVGG